MRPQLVIIVLFLTTVTPKVHFTYPFLDNYALLADEEKHIIYQYHLNTSTFINFFVAPCVAPALIDVLAGEMYENHFSIFYSMQEHPYLYHTKITPTDQITSHLYVGQKVISIVPNRQKEDKLVVATMYKLILFNLTTGESKVIKEYSDKIVWSGIDYDRSTIDVVYCTGYDLFSMDNLGYLGDRKIDKCYTKFFADHNDDMVFLSEEDALYRTKLSVIENFREGELDKTPIVFDKNKFNVTEPTYFGLMSRSWEYIYFHFKDLPNLYAFKKSSDDIIKIKNLHAYMIFVKGDGEGGQPRNPKVVNPPKVLPVPPYT